MCSFWLRYILLFSRSHTSFTRKWLVFGWDPTLLSLALHSWIRQTFLSTYTLWVESQQTLSAIGAGMFFFRFVHQRIMKDRNSWEHKRLCSDILPEITLEVMYSRVGCQYGNSCKHVISLTHPASYCTVHCYFYLSHCTCDSLFS